MTTSYFDMLNAVENYYGSGSDQWLQIAKYGISADNAESILSQVPGVALIKNSNGTIRSYTYDAVSSIKSGSSIAEELNSNLQSGTASIVNNKIIKIPSNMGVNDTGKLTLKSGMKSAGKFVFSEVAPAVAAAGVGISLGKTIDKVLYNANPDFWDSNGMSSINPDTWNSITSDDDSLGAKLFNVVFGIEGDTTQAYLDENALAYLAYYMQKKGVFDDTIVTTPSEITKNKYPDLSANISFAKIPTKWSLNLKTGKEGSSIVPTSQGDDIFMTTVKWVREPNYSNLYVSKKNFSMPGKAVNSFGSNGETGYYSIDPGFSLDRSDYILYYQSIPYKNGVEVGIEKNNVADFLGRTILYGNKTISSNVEGISSAPNANVANLSNATSVDDALQKLKEQYPELWNNSIENEVVQPDGSVKTYTYVPVAMPELDKNGNPVSSSSNQTDPQINPATATESLIETITDLLSKIPPINPPATGSGGTPVVPPVTGKASALYSIYNPTLAQVNSLGAWLWSSNFIDQLLKLFSSPMDAIIGLHKIYATPATGGAQNIKVGYLDSGVPSRIVTEQYTTVDCGKVNCYEYFGNVLDYNPYTNIRLYLPFIGIIDLSNSDVMRSNINVVYHVDVLSGACLAEVKITRDGGGGTLYQYAGNAATTLPISSGSYMGVVSSVSSVATRALAGFASGGALGAIASGATGILNAQGTNVVHSGGFSGNAGAMGCKKPYLIIERPQTETADNTERMLGYGSNLFTKLKTCAGFTRVKGVHVDAVPATKEEKKLIEDKLLAGVIIG